jgi:hypothetical protein
VVADDGWKVRPIQLPRGSYDWTPFLGVFALPQATANLRLLSEDRGEVWLDDIRIEPLP